MARTAQGYTVHNDNKEYDMKATIPGLGSQSGNMDYPIYPKGKYTMQITKMTYEDKTAEKNLHYVTTEMVIVDGPDRASGKSTIGGKYTHRLYIPTPEHKSYSDDWYGRATNELAALCIAVGYKAKSDVLNTDFFKGKTLDVTLGEKMGKDQEGNERPENVVRKFAKDLQAEAEGTED